MKRRVFCFFLSLVLLLPPAALAAPSSDYTLTGLGADDIMSVVLAQEGKRRRDYGWTYDWCAYFVCWAGRAAGQNFPDTDLPTPMHVAQWFINNDAGTFYCFRKKNYTSLVRAGITRTENIVSTTREEFTLRKGDIICYLWHSDAPQGYNWSHIGFAAADYDGSGVILSAEGNVTPDSMTPAQAAQVPRANWVMSVKERDYDDRVVGVIRPNYTGVTYQVTHMLEQLDGTYAEAGTDSYSLTTWDDAPASFFREFRGFEAAGETRSAVTDGTVQVTCRYTRRQYTVAIRAGEGVTAEGAGAYRYGDSVTVSARPAPYYSWSGWSGSISLSEQSAAFTMPAEDVSLSANVRCIYPFRDVDPGAWYADSVYAAHQLGLIRGSDQRFMPGSQVTLAEAVTMAVRAHASASGGSVPDAAEDEAWYEPYVCYAREYGIIDGEYDYDQPASREEFVHILAAVLPAGEPELLRDAPVFADEEDITDPEEVRLLYRMGIVNGVSQDEGLCFLPQTYLLRAEAAALLTRVVCPELRVS